MNWGVIVLLVLVLSGAVWVWVKMYGDQSGAFSCIHCGECIAAGECIYRKNPKGKSAKKQAGTLDKGTK